MQPAACESRWNLKDIANAPGVAHGIAKFATHTLLLQARPIFCTKQLLDPACLFSSGIQQIDDHPCCRVLPFLLLIKAPVRARLPWNPDLIGDVGPLCTMPACVGIDHYSMMIDH